MDETHVLYVRARKFTRALETVRKDFRRGERAHLRFNSALTEGRRKEQNELKL